MVRAFGIRQCCKVAILPADDAASSQIRAARDPGLGESYSWQKNRAETEAPGVDAVREFPNFRIDVGWCSRLAVFPLPRLLCRDRLRNEKITTCLCAGLTHRSCPIPILEAFLCAPWQPQACRLLPAILGRLPGNKKYRIFLSWPPPFGSECGTATKCRKAVSLALGLEGGSQENT